MQCAPTLLYANRKLRGRQAEPLELLERCLVELMEVPRTPSTHEQPTGVKSSHGVRPLRWDPAAGCEVNWLRLLQGFKVHHISSWSSVKLPKRVLPDEGGRHALRTRRLPFCDYCANEQCQDSKPILAGEGMSPYKGKCGYGLWPLSHDTPCLPAPFYLGGGLPVVPVSLGYSRR